MGANDQARNRTVRNLVIFSAVVISCGWVGLWVESLLGSEAQGIGQLIWIVTPLIFSFLLRAFGGDGWKDLGIRPSIGGNAFGYAVSLLVHPITATLVLAVGFGLGSVTFPGLSLNQVGVLLQGSVAALAPMFLKNIFEEFAWRGYLAPKMYTLPMNTFVAHAVVGLIWASWHLPYYFIFLDRSALQAYTTLSMGALLPLVFIGSIALSVIYGEIRLLTHSVWPALLMHTIGNAFVNTLILGGFYRIANGMGFLVSPGLESVLSIVLFTLIGVGIHAVRGRFAAREQAQRQVHPAH